HKEPHKRYASAGELAEDLRRFLAGEPIRARPVSAPERAIKWARRNPLAAALLAVVVAVTGAGLGLVLWQWRHAVANAAEATRQKTGTIEARNAAADAHKEAVANAAEATRQKNETIKARNAEADAHKEAVANAAEATRQKNEAIKARDIATKEQARADHN